MTGAERAAVALMATCGFCWAKPGVACSEEGLHLARYLRAYQRGLLSRETMTVICQALPQVSAGYIVAEVTATPR
jgi:hypothetical protein